MRIQISFLGKARQDARNGYRTANYKFQDDQVVATAFFGLELARKVQPEKLYLLGTAGSMWDVLLDSLDAEILGDGALLDLWQQTQDASVNEQLLTCFEPMLSERLGIECCLRVIPYARDQAEQAALLARLAEWLKQGDELILDVTHGLRHLPMLMLAAAHYLEVVRGVTVQEIYYGALEMTPDPAVGSTLETPVISLKGLLHLLDWVQALAADASSGDYAVFQPLLAASGMTADSSQCLAEAAYFERITHPVKAREKLTLTQKYLEKLDDPLVSLFRNELTTRTNWWKTGIRGDWEAKLAWRWFDRRDYLRTALYAQEALISRNVENGKHNDFDAREQVRKSLLKNEQAKQLFTLRNALAHGVRSQDQKTNRLLGDENALREALGKWMKDLLGMPD